MTAPADAATAAEAFDARVDAAVDDGIIHVERALRLVRVAAAVIAMAAVIGVRSAGSSLGHGVLLAVYIATSVLVMNGFTLLADRRGWKTASMLGGQVLDVAGSLGLVVILDHALGGAGWMVLLLPVVMGGVRFGAAGTLLAWTLCSAGFLGLALTNTLKLGDNSSEAFALSLQRFAFLLALAVPVAALTQWMQQRWEHQRVLTRAAAGRAQRLAMVEELARALAGSTESELLAQLSRGVLRMGFETATITRQETVPGQGSGPESLRWATVAVVGESNDLPSDEVAAPEPDETVVTRWEDGQGVVSLYSVSVPLDLDGEGAALVLHAWTPEPVADDVASALGLLGAHARVALQGAHLLAELRTQATRDPLTHLFNRRAYNDQLDRLSERPDPVALLLLDLDHFKDVNDTYGHPAGDKLLRVISDRLVAAASGPGMEGEASVARIGGDEFAVILAGSSEEEVVGVAERIELAMREPIALGPASVAVSFSIGIADAVGEWEVTDLVDAADEATYQAKSHGRARSCWAPATVGGPWAGPIELSSSSLGGMTDSEAMSIEEELAEMVTESETALQFSSRGEVIAPIGPASKSIGLRDDDVRTDER